MYLMISIIIKIAAAFILQLGSKVHYQLNKLDQCGSTWPINNKEN